MKINFFSVDLKLVDSHDPETRSFRVLEFNDGLRSGFTGYDSLGGQKMVSGKVRADYETLFPDFRVVALNGPMPEKDSRPVIMLPRTDKLTGEMGRMGLMVAGRLQESVVTPNADLHLRMLSENKAYQSYMAEKINASKPLFPPTTILPSAWKEARADLAKMPSCDEGYVIKPLTLYGGTGVRLIASDRLEKDVSGYLSRKRYRDGDSWVGMQDPACLVQHRVPPCPVETDQGVFDGTMRVAFTVYGEDGADFKCHIHDAYWKLPQFSIEEMKGANSIISYSPSNRDADRNFLSRIFSLATFVNTHVRSQAVDADIKAWLFPQLALHFAPFFTAVKNMDYLENTHALLHEKSIGLQGLGLMMATHPAFYPSADATCIDTHYPSRLIDAFTSSGIATERNGFLQDHLHNIVKSANKFMHCEDTDAEFVQPLKTAMGRDMMQIMFGLMNQITNRL